MLRIFLCRATFIFGILAPTVMVSAWAVHRAQPAYQNARQEEWLRFFASRFGVKATADRVTYPSYYVARIDNLQLTDAETNAPLLKCRSLETARTKQGWIVEASQPEIRADQLAKFADLVEARILKHAPDDAANGEVEIGELTLKTDEQAATLTHVRILWSSTAKASELEVLFHVAGIASPQPCRLVLKRERAGSEPTTRWEFSSGNVQLPCSLLATWLPALKPLGRAATFVGRASGDTTGTTSHSEVTGNFFDLELQTLVGDYTAHKFVAKDAVVSVAPLKFKDGRITELRGTVECSKGGSVSESFLAAAREHLRWTTDRQLPPAEYGMLNFSRLACGFRLDRSGLTLEGGADPKRNGVIFNSATGPLLLEPAEQPLPTAALLRAMAPQTGVQIPAAKETQPLLDVLPAPSVQPQPKTPRTKVRVSGVPS